MTILLDGRFQILSCRHRDAKLARVSDDARPVDAGMIVQETLDAFPFLEPELVLNLLACVPSSHSVDVPCPAFSDHDFAEALKQFPPRSLAALPPAVFEAITCLEFIESAAYLVNATAGVIVPQLRLLARLSPPEHCPNVSDRHAVLLAYGGGSPIYDFSTLACTDSFCETIAATARQVKSPCLVMPRSPLVNADFVAWVDRTHPRLPDIHDQQLLEVRRTLQHDVALGVVGTNGRADWTKSGPLDEAEALTLVRGNALTAKERSVLFDCAARLGRLDSWAAHTGKCCWPSGAESWSILDGGLQTVALEPTIMAAFERRPTALPQLIKWLERNGLTFDPKVLPESLTMRAVARCHSPRYVPERDGWLQQWLLKEAGGGRSP
jgi:hypothetical protein